ncbi:MAG: hypothetical protein RBS80_06260 [Thermoguttaceae bacterium]|jgi:hypothetical protein|nr:hypothetical protein [Thermoguttaceae bacterium]
MRLLNVILALASLPLCFPVGGAVMAADRRAPSAPPPEARMAIVEEVAEHFGPRLEARGPAILTRGSMDAVWHEGWLFVLSRGRLCTFRAPLEPGAEPAGQLDGLGATRQIEIAGRLAAITSREDGLWLVDVADPEKPVLLSHYDTIELATGIALGENLALVACRQYGVEQVDVSDPRRPRHLSTFRTGEAQSVFLHDGLAYIGDWAPRAVVVCDVRDPWRPAEVAQIPLDGYGDGVFVRGDICFAATGHHARAAGARDPSDPAYGRGHGLEIFDVADPRNPKLISRTKLPRFYSLGYDMWDVQVSGDYAVVGDTHNGLYVFDVRELARPVPVGHFRLPPFGRDQLPDAIGGFAIGSGCIYVAGIGTGLHTVPLPGIEPIPPAPPQRAAIAATRPPDQVAAPARVAYRPEGGQVHEVAVDARAGDVWVAAGKAGLHRLRLDPDEGRQVAPTEGVALSVDVCGDLLAMGEGVAGLSLWRPTAAGAELIARYRSSAGGIGQVCISPDARHVVAHAGPNVLEVLDVSSSHQPKRVLDDRQVGLFYRTPLSHGFLPDGRFGCMWHASGIFVFASTGDEGPRFAGWMVPGRINLGDGMAVFQDRFLVTTQGGYAVLDEGQAEIASDAVARMPGVNLRGKPTVFGSTLYVAQRWRGSVHAVDLADPKHPSLLWSLQVDGNPGPVREHAGQAVIPAGYDGVIVRPR